MRSFRLLMVAGILLISSAGFSQHLTKEAAQEAAQQWVMQKHQRQVKEILLVDSILSDNQTTFYRFKLNPVGFIWASADYQGAPILAYSFECNDPLSQEMHPAEEFSSLYNQEISKAREALTAKSRPHPGWTELVDSRLKGFKTDEVVEPMMEVTWGQGSGYNQFTPENTPTGCVAVAMLQVMRHWEWPAQPKGDHSYTHDTYGDFAINFDTIQYNWANMPLNNPNEDIAKAMLYTGIALHMNYAPGGSGASTSRAQNLMISSFRYHEKSRYVSKDDFGATDNWVRVIKNEMINGRPVIYRGQGTGGHAFNFDGFDGDYFHVNWGWSGSSNGYFLVSSLTPGNNNFSEGQGAAINLFPDTLLMWDRPFGVRVLASDSKVSLGWGGVYNGELGHYNIYRNNELIGQANQRNYTDDTAENGTVYSYSVSAVYETDTANYESERTADIAVAPAEGFLVPYSEDFEDGYPGWTLAANSLGFQWGTAADLGMGTDTTNHIIGINSGMAGNNKLVSDYLVSNGLDFGDLSHVVLSFDYAIRRWQDVDHLYVYYRVFEDNKWVEIAEVEPTKGYHDWISFKTYLPAGAMKDNVQIAFFYTDNGEVGYGAAIDNIKLTQIDEPGIPNFSVSAQETCMGTEVIFNDLSQGTKGSYSWDFGEGAVPRYAEDEGPHTVYYQSSGAKTVRLILNELDELTRDEAITIFRPATARFSKSINQKTVTFRNTSTNAEVYFWDFGDGIRVSQESPVHTYAKSGDYRVTLVATNSVCGNDTTEQLISIHMTAREDVELIQTISVYPNPVEDLLTIEWDGQGGEDGKIEVLNLGGQCLINQDINSSNGHQKQEIDMSHLPEGIYCIQISLNGKVQHKKVIKY